MHCGWHCSYCTLLALDDTAVQARLAELELPQLAATLAATAAAATAASRRRAPTQQRGISTKRSRAEQLPMRQSARTRGQAPDPTTAGGIDYEARDGRVVLASFVPERYGSSAAGHTSSGVGAESAAAVSRPPPEPLPFSSRNGDDSTDGHFLQQLQALAAASGAPAAAKKSSGSSNGSSSSSGLLDGDGLMQLRLQASDVAKLTTQGVSCLAFHPSSSKPIIAAADKSGKVRGGPPEMIAARWLWLKCRRTTTKGSPVSIEFVSFPARTSAFGLIVLLVKIQMQCFVHQPLMSDGIGKCSQPLLLRAV